MTRIETALARMAREAGVEPEFMAPAVGGQMLANPTGKALAALVEAAEAWRGGRSDYVVDGLVTSTALADTVFALIDAVDAFRAATTSDGPA